MRSNTRLHIAHTHARARRYQTAAWHPFFRGHAHLETRRREPWLFGDDNTQRIRSAIRRRYDAMPYLCGNP